MFILKFSEWELIYKLLERRELQLRQILEADQHCGVESQPHVIQEYQQICETLNNLSEPTGHSWSRSSFAFKSSSRSSTPPTPTKRTPLLANGIEQEFSSVSSRARS